MTKLLKRVAIVSQTGDRTVTYQICSSAQQTHHIKKKKKDTCEHDYSQLPSC